MLQVVTDTDRRGAQVFGVDLHAALERRGWRVRTVALAPGRNGNGLELPALGPGGLRPETFGRLRGEMAAAGVVVAHGSRTLPACALAGLGVDAPFVYRSIGDPLYWANTRIRRLRVRLGLGRAAAVVALWEGAAEALSQVLGVARPQITVIPNAVPAARCPRVDRHRRPAAREALGLAPDRPTVAYVGALTPEKNVGLAISAVGAVEDCQLVVAGDGPLRQRLEALAAEEARERVAFLGATCSSRPALAAADILILPSRSEGMPAVVIEAGLSGLGTVATAVGALKEMVVPGETGELVPPDDVDALAGALTTGLSRAEAYGSAARTRCLERFELDPVADLWSGLLARVASRTALELRGF